MKWRTSCWLAFLMLSWIMGASLAHAVEYTFQTIDYPGASETRVFGVNNAGHLVGVYEVGSEEYGFLYDGTNYTKIEVPGAVETNASGVNLAGQIVGSYEDNDENTHGFLYDGANFTIIDYPGASETYAYGINDANTIVGISDGGKTFLYDGANFTNIDVPLAAIKNAINNAGQIAGTTLIAVGDVGGFYGFFYDSGHYVTLYIIGESNLALGINDAGHVCGAYTNDSFDNLQGFVDDGSDYTTIQVPDSTTTLAMGINNAGQTGGFYADSLGDIHGFLADPVPLPGSVFLMGSGLLSLGLWGWRRRQQG
jgi:probable HAF family extracellular repeat protein